jgi:hypothetical protein
MGDVQIVLATSGPDERSAVESGLLEVLRLARRESESDATPDETDATDEAAVAIRGQGADLGTVFFELANDLLSRLDDHGVGLRAVRLDGLLRTQDGYTGWGYLLGRTGEGEPPRGVTLDRPPEVERRDAGVTLRLRLFVV